MVGADPRRETVALGVLALVVAGRREADVLVLGLALPVLDAGAAVHDGALADLEHAVAADPKFIDETFALISVAPVGAASPGFAMSFDMPNPTVTAIA
jgi:hypothetical protein